MRLRTQILLVLALPALVPLLFIFIHPGPQGTEGLPPEVIESLNRLPATVSPVPMPEPGFQPASVSPSTLRSSTPRLVEIGSYRYVVFRVDKDQIPHFGWIPFTLTLGFYFLLLLFVVMFFRRFDKSIVSLANATGLLPKAILTPQQTFVGTARLSSWQKRWKKCAPSSKTRMIGNHFFLWGSHTIFAHQLRR